MRRFLTVTALLVGCADAPSPPIPEPHFDFGCPNASLLACTGLYGEAGEHWYSKRPGEDVKPFEPGVALWSDHMQKQRYLWLPPGSVIDARDADNWRFPVGTKFWKEFAYEGKRIETRYLEKLDYAWYPATFRWNDDESNAFLMTEGERDVPGTFNDSYEVPRTEDCKRCHAGAADHILGFSAVVMADPNAKGFTLNELQAAGQLAPLRPPPVVPGTPPEQTALRYLHVNCGLACHNPSFDAEAWWTGFYLKLEVNKLQTVAETATFRTGVGIDSYVPASNGLSYLKLIAPGDPEHSAVVFRESQRGTEWQMPPLATHSVDQAGVAAVTAWIAALPH